MKIQGRQYLILWSVCFGLLLSCEGSNRNGVVAWPHGVKYEIFVQSFADGNGDGKGDFKGLSNKLDHLQDLGVNAIWLMPVMNSPSYHKYDVTDYKSIHPDYGTMDDFKDFVKEAHRRNIKVIVDLVLNHTSTEHPWFQRARENANSPYRNYYIWGNRDSIRSQIAKKIVSLDSDNIVQWHAVDGDTLSDHYYGFFWGGMPDLNFDNQKVREEFVEIGKFWLAEMEVDGFRLDAAKHIFPSDRATDNHAFWVEFRRSMEAIKPDVYLVGEVWSEAKQVAPFLKGLPSLFNFDMGYAITGTMNAGRDTIGLIRKYKEISDYYESFSSEYIDAPFLRNHDQNRILSELGGSEEKMRVAAGILLTLPGTPYLYYGEEIGMLGMKPDEHIREPFVWDFAGQDQSQTSWITAKYSTDETIAPLSKQRSDPGSLFNFYKKLINFRNSNKALTYGTIEDAGFNPMEIVGFRRLYEGEELLVLNNVSDVEVTLQWEAERSRFESIEYDSREMAKLQDDVLILPAYSTVILK